MMAETKDRIFGLDIIRCIAILFVLLSHTAFILPISETSKDFVMGCFGFAGVEFFFVLSGYLIGKILLELLQKRSPSFPTIKYFWIRRWFRTLPAYYLTLVLYAVLYYWVNKKFIFADGSHLLYFVFLQNFFSGPPEFFRHSWSLSVEEWFYLALPVWLVFFHRFIKRMSVLQVIIAGIVVFTLFRFIGVMAADPNWNLGARTIVPLRLDSLMIGVLMAYLHLHHADKWEKYAKPCFITGLIMLVPLSVWLWFDMLVTPETAHFLSKTIYFSLYSIAVALCLPFMSLIRSASVKWVGRVITHVSLVSYSLYLIHTIAIHLFLSAHYIICYKLGISNTIFVKFAGSWIACLLVASIMYRYYEKPMMNLRERFRLKSATTPVSSV